MQGSALLGIFINDMEVGTGGDVAMAVSDSELLRKADGSKLQKNLRTL